MEKFSKTFSFSKQKQCTNPFNVLQSKQNNNNKTNKSDNRNPDFYRFDSTECFERRTRLLKSRLFPSPPPQKKQNNNSNSKVLARTTKNNLNKPSLSKVINPFQGKALLSICKVSSPSRNNKNKPGVADSGRS